MVNIESFKNLHYLLMQEFKSKKFSRLKVFTLRIRFSETDTLQGLTPRFTRTYMLKNLG